MNAIIFLSFFHIPIIAGDCDKNIWHAQYMNGVMTICKEDITVGLLIHETGHAYKDKVMTKKQEKLWNKISKKCSKRECFVSDYAMTNAEEDFAETFTFVGRSKGEIPENETLKLKVEFMKKLLDLGYRK